MSGPPRMTWTPTDDAILRRMSAAGAPIADMAKALRRGETLVIRRRGELGLARKPATPLAELLVSAAAAFGDAVFTEQDLAVAAWRRWPVRFGLGHGQLPHPDSKVVAACLSARTSGPIDRGWMERVGPCLLRLTEAGKAARAAAA